MEFSGNPRLGPIRWPWELSAGAYSLALGLESPFSFVPFLLGLKHSTLRDLQYQTAMVMQLHFTV